MEKLKNISFIGILMLLVCAVLGITDVSAMGAEVAVAAGGATNTQQSTGAGGNLAAGSIAHGAANLHQTETDSPNLLDWDIDRLVCEYEPENHPLTAILSASKAKHKTTNAMRHRFYSIDVGELSTTVSAANAAFINGVGRILVDDYTIFNEQDTIVVIDPTTKDVLLNGFVEEVDETTGLKVQVIYDKNVTTTPPTVAAGAIAADSIVTAAGNAFADWKKQTISGTHLPSEDYNYCQIFKWQVGETTIHRLSAKEADWTLDDIERRELLSMTMKMETSILLGERGCFYNVGKKQNIYTMGGILSSIKSKGITVTLTDTTGTPLSNAQLIDMGAQIFAGNGGSKKRIMLCGTDFSTRISKIPTVQKQIEALNTEINWGMSWTKISFGGGKELIYQDYQHLDRLGLGNCAIVIDPEYLEKIVFEGYDNKRDVIDNAEDFDGVVNITTKVFTVALKYPSCHAFIDINTEEPE